MGPRSRTATPATTPTPTPSVTSTATDPGWMSMEQAYDPYNPKSILYPGPPTQEQEGEGTPFGAEKLGMDVEAASASGTFEFDGKFYVLPTQMSDGKPMSDAEAAARYRKTGEFLGGPFESEAAARSWEDNFLGYYNPTPKK